MSKPFSPPSTATTSAHAEPASPELTRFARQVIRRVAWRHALPWLVRGCAAGLLAAAVILLLARLTPWDGAAWWAPAALLGLTGVGAAVAWLTRPAPPVAIRSADRALRLHERLVTAWEYGDRQTPILRLQRADLAERVAGLDLKRRLPLHLARREAALPSAGVLALVLALALPTPHARAQPAVNPATHARITHAAARINTARQTAASVPPSTLAALPKVARLRQAQIARILARLQHDLAATHTQAQALRTIAQAQTALNRLANPQAAAQHAALAALSAALLRAAAMQKLAAALQRGDPRSIAAAMQKLAASLSRGSAAQRAALAKELQQAAHAASSDASLSSALQNAATSLAQDDTSGAQAALRAAGTQSAADAASTAQQSALDQATSSLDNARNDVSGLQDSSSPGSSGQGGQGQGGQSGQSGKGGQGQGGQGQGQGNGQGSGTGSGQGDGQGQGGGQGQGQGSGNGDGTGQGQGQGQGSGAGHGAGGGSGGAGGGGRGGGRGTNGGSGRNGGTGSRVYVPAPQGKNGPTSTTRGSQAAPAPGSVQPWRAVLPQYQRGANNAIANGSLPPDQRALVKRYFDGLSH